MAPSTNNYKYRLRIQVHNVLRVHKHIMSAQNEDVCSCVCVYIYIYIYIYIYLFIYICVGVVGHA